ncbi:MAG TPA: PAS domain-containing protein [Methylobacter sp.]|jgi:PAS domain S-box-containing protein
MIDLAPITANSPTILIVDDTPINLGVVVESLENRGLRLVVAQDGMEGLQRAAFVKPDLILLDVMMPEMDGFEVCRRLKTNADTADIPVIFMTALAETEHKITGFKVGGVDYITKPMQIDEVVARVGTHLNLRTMQRQLQAQNAQLQEHQMELEQRVMHRTAELSTSNRLLREEIEERKRAEETLALREREFRTLAENAPDSIIRYDRETRILYMNPVLERSLGVATAATMGRRPDELRPQSEAMLRYQKLLEHVIATGEPAEFEMISEPVVDDNTLHCLIRLAPEIDDHGEVVGAIAISRDYTEQKRLEQELVRREREFRTLAENSPDAIARYDRDCRRVYFNQAYMGAVGIGMAEALGKTPLECWWVISPSAEEYTARLQQAMNSGETDELLTEMTDQEGKPAYRIMSLVPEFDEDNRAVSVLSISHDVTGIKRMEAMLRKSELEFRTLAENSPGMIVRYDRDCRRIYINPAYEHQTGIPVETAWNKTPYEVWKPLMPCEEFVVRLNRVMETGEPDRILLEWHEPDGSLVSHDMHAVAEFDEEKQVIGALVIGHNITELKATERRLEESRTQLRTLTAKREEAREEERKRIAREIHDELGQLLNVLRLNVTTLDFRFGDANSDLRDKTHKMVGTVDRAILMVRNLATRLRPAVLSSGIVYALDWLVQEYTESTGIVCKLHLPADEVSLDEDRAMVVFRIVQESLTNVLRHSGADRVDITLRSVAGTCEVEVCDNGKGFEPGNIDRPNSFGIVGMHERTLILKGTLDIANAKAGGAVLKLRIPME